MRLNNYLQEKREEILKIKTAAKPIASAVKNVLLPPIASLIGVKIRPDVPGYAPVSALRFTSNRLFIKRK